MARGVFRLHLGQLVANWLSRLCISDDRPQKGVLGLGIYSIIEGSGFRSRGICTSQAIHVALTLNGENPHTKFGPRLLNRLEPMLEDPH